jgi:hypothetical protein
MILALKNNSGFSEELILKNQTVRISNLFNYLQLTIQEERLNEVKINDSLLSCEYKEDGSYIIPCYMSRENHTTIQLMIDGRPIRIVVKYDEELFVGDSLIDSFADFHRNVTEWLGDEKKTIDSLVEAIKKGEIHLLQIINPLTGLDDDSLLDDINKILPFALDICTKPRQHLRIEEEVLDVELVKRITPSSLQHLASHSEHWRSRTITGLIPSRLRAEVYEDDFNIYENIFFRMVIEAILKYIVKKHNEVKIAISQKDTLHDWEYYAAEINDFKKLEMLQSLLPDYDSDSEEGMRKKFKDLESMILSIEKQLSSIISTPFFQNLDSTKQIELPIQPTNIINMDNRYNELLKVWNKLLTHNNKQTQQDLTGGNILNIDEYYKVYIQVLSIYSLHLLGYQFHENSVLELDGNNKFKFNFKFGNKYCLVNVQNISQELEEIIKFNVEESLFFEVNVPNNFPVSFMEYEDKNVVKEIWKDNEQILLFRKKPDSDLEKQLSQVVKKYIDEHKSLTTKQKIDLKKLDLEWRKTLANQLSKISENRTFELNVHVLFSLIGSSEKNLSKYTNSIFESVTSSSNCTDIYILPINLEVFSKIQNPGLLQRIINFGERFSDEDAQKYGNYRMGILPISQTDLRSAQRLSKLFNMYINLQTIKWGALFQECPTCNSKNISKMDEHSWFCRELDCHMVWGITKCSSGCNEYFEWMKPNLKVRLNKLPNPNSESFHLDKILFNEMLFDRMVITSFNYKIDKDNEFIYNPQCPKCGKSSVN